LEAHILQLKIAQAYRFCYINTFTKAERRNAMPLFEFRCLKCNDLFEILVMGKQDELEMQCPHCGSEDFERVMSSSTYAAGPGPGQATRPDVQSRQCGAGNCTTVTLPGHSKD
jgi:putative FmdB family regulatory protein